jgi:hypothetical protein
MKKSAVVGRTRRLTVILGAPFRALGRLDAFERVFYGGVLLLGVGLALIWVPLGLIVPGAAISGVAFHLRTRKT